MDMLSFIDWGDPLWLALGGAAVVVFGLSLLRRWVDAVREGARRRRLRHEVRANRTFAEEQKLRTEELATRILATSSTSEIVGFDVVRQIEAVFTDGHPSPIKAVAALKALAAAQGANAIINLSSDKPPSGRYVARGDAVIVRAHELPPEASPKTQPKE